MKLLGPIDQIRKKVKKEREGRYLKKKKLLKKLKITQDDFRKLCIYKGIYPEDYKKVPQCVRGKFAKEKICYRKEDYKKLANEKLIHDFRKKDTILKKYFRHKRNEEHVDAKRVVKNLPKFKLDHIIKKRFPTLSHAIEHLSDAISAISVYSNLSPMHIKGLDINCMVECKELIDHFHYYIYKTQKLTKAFIAVDRYFLQANILKKDVTWIIAMGPSFSKWKETDGLKTLTEFVEYYISLVKFILFKLYQMEYMQYPPVVNMQLKTENLRHLAYDLEFVKTIKKETEGVKKEKQTEVIEKDKKREEIKKNDDENQKTKGTQQIHEMNEKLKVETFAEETTMGTAEEAENKRKKLFQNQVYLIHYNQPLLVLSIIILSCGGKIALDDTTSPYSYERKEITHEICNAKHKFFKENSNSIKYERNLIHPQYVFDCLNQNELLSCEQYFYNNAVIPPHLSPFADYEQIRKVKKHLEAINAQELENIENNYKKLGSNKFQIEEECREIVYDMSKNFVKKNTEQMQNADSNEKKNLLENKQGKDSQQKIDKSSYAANTNNKKLINSEVKRMKLLMNKKKKRLYNKLVRKEQKEKKMIERLAENAKNIHEKEAKAAQILNKEQKKIKIEEKEKKKGIDCAKKKHKKESQIKFLIGKDNGIKNKKKSEKSEATKKVKKNGKGNMKNKRKRDNDKQKNKLLE